MHYSLEYPYFLLLLPLLLCFIYCKKTTSSQLLPRLDWIPKQQRRVNLNTLVKITIFILSTIALSSPFSYASITPSQKYGRAIVLALDTSGSMRESGFSKKEQSRDKFSLMLDLAKDFIQMRHSDNIGIVAYGTFAYTAVPITYDHKSLQSILSMLEVEIAGKNTAIGDAIAQSITTLSFSQAKEKIAIMITDGINNAGTISIKEAVSKAADKKIKIYTIGIGKEYDHIILDKIATETGAKSFSAKDAKALKEVYAQIDALLPSKIRSEQYHDKSLYFPSILAIIVLLFLFLLLREERLL